MAKSKPSKFHGNLKDLTDQIFGRLTVVKRVKNNPHGDAQWLCQCRCGNSLITEGYSLRKGRTKSCGCLRKEVTIQKHTIHGLSQNPEYYAWYDMINRCYNPTNIGFHNYGGRGIKVCQRWHSLINFITDMGFKPSPEYTLERINNNRGYEPQNCCWATRKSQARNKRTNTMVSFQGQIKPLIEWAEELKMSYSAIVSRISSGWSIYNALTIPIQKKHKLS